MKKLLAILLMALVPTSAFSASRVKDIAVLQSVRDNQLIGYGLVIGLQGTGDGLRNAPFTEQSLRSMLDVLGVPIENGRTRSKNVAAVIVTANLPPFARAGARVDVSVSSLGDATSLAGGTLVMTPLRGANGEIFAVAQGPLIVSGFEAAGQAEKVTQGVPTVGRVPNGAIVEREIKADFADVRSLTLQLRNPDFSTAVAVTDVINSFARDHYKMALAQEQDSRSIEIRLPPKVTPTRFFAQIENLAVHTQSPARVVMDERTGTIVIGEDVRVSRVAISHGTLSVRVTESPEVVQPNPFSRGETAVQPNTFVDVNQSGGSVSTVEGVDLQSLVDGLNRLGVKPTDIIAILQAIKSAGALQADLVMQ